MRKVLALTLAFLIQSCGKSEIKSPEPVFDAELAERYYDYKNLIASQQDSHGFIYTEDCDALLFTALAGLALGTVDIRAAREDNGRWHRRPAKDCYPKHSKSTISRDMLLGVMWYAYYHRDLELAENLWSYGRARHWIMGDGVRSRTQFSPSLVASLGQLIHVLGGEDHAERYLLPHFDAPGLIGFEAHLQVLNILLRLRLYGKIDEVAEQRIKEQIAREPQNPLFQYAAGNTSEAINLLKRIFPAKRLPTSDDHCAPWLFQRDFGRHWEPCADGKTHSGGDLLFLGHLILNR